MSYIQLNGTCILLADHLHDDICAEAVDSWEKAWIDLVLMKLCESDLVEIGLLLNGSQKIHVTIPGSKCRLNNSVAHLQNALKLLEQSADEVEDRRLDLSSVQRVD